MQSHNWYLNSEDALSLDQELMGPEYGFSLE